MAETKYRKPHVSIIIPCFNRAKLISETLESVLKQNFDYWEAIVIDDGSNDRTCKIVEEFSEKDSRICLYFRNHEPKGASTCRNIGIGKAKGEYIIFLDSDDLLLPFCLEQRVSYMSLHPELDFAVFQMLSFDHQGIINDSYVVKQKEDYLYAYLRHDLPWQTSCPIWKFSFIKNHLTGYNVTYPRLQDPEFNTRALLVDGVSFQVLHKSEPDCLYRSHTDKTFASQSLLIGFELYLVEFFEKTKKRVDAIVCKENLIYSFIEAIRSFYTYKGNKFDKKSIKIIKHMTRFSYNQNLIDIRTVCLTMLLILLYALRINYLPGGKYILRVNMKLLKTST
jgi:glycosyltransferase involved in cell wall biosynthesis